MHYFFRNFMLLIDRQLKQWDGADNPHRIPSCSAVRNKQPTQFDVDTPSLTSISMDR